MMIHTFFFLALVVPLYCQTPPTKPTLPAAWHANVQFVAEGLIPFETSLAAAYTGVYYHDWNNQRASFVIRDAVSGHPLHEIISGSTVYEVDSGTGNCSSAPATSDKRFQLLPPNFLSTKNFQFVGKEYYLRGSVFFETEHWQYISADETIHYWHGVDAKGPFRIMYGSVSPLILDFSSNVVGFSDVPNLSYIFTVPSNCNNNSAVERASPIREAMCKLYAHKLLRFLTPRKQKAQAEMKRSPQLIAKPWPQQWNARSAYTGNDFGFGKALSLQKALNHQYSVEEILRDIPEFGEPSTVGISLIGHYYYDWTGMRECNTWVDAVSGETSKTLIVNGTYYLIYFATGQCEIVPIKPVGGPLKYDWPTRIPYHDEEWLNRDTNYLRANHFLFDALNAGNEHAFNYWSRTDFGTPLQFQGPVLDFPPYGQSMMVWGEVSGDLAGVDLDFIFSVPSNCIPLSEDEFYSHRMAPLVNHHLNFIKWVSSL